MVDQEKIINVLLLNGTLDGVVKVSDTTRFEELYFSPRDASNELLKNEACKKFGVYLLLSQEKIYVGQAKDLSRRIKQHLEQKLWWDKVILLTTSNDSLNKSDIDYLENVLIQKASSLTIERDNRQNGNAPKVDEIRERSLKKHLNEWFLFMRLTGTMVFEEKDYKRNQSRPRTKDVPQKSKSQSTVKTEGQLSFISSIPPLPDGKNKIGAFVYQAMYNLSTSGYVFTEEQVAEMCTPEWSKLHFHTIKPFMKKYIDGKTDNKGQDGHVRFKSDIYTFGDQKVLISKEWYERQRQFFISWYNSLE